MKKINISKTCPACGLVFQRRGKESSLQFKLKKTCSRRVSLKDVLLILGIRGLMLNIKMKHFAFHSPMRSIFCGFRESSELSEYKLWK